MGLSGVQWFLWVGCFVEECVLLAVLLLRRRAAGFPAFTSLIAFCIARTVVLFSIGYRYGVNNSPPYLWAYWSLGYVYDLILLAVFFELARQVFCPTGTWARDIRRAFQWLVGCSLLLALFLTWLASPPFTHWYETYLLRSDLFVSLLMSELFIGAMALAARAGLPWKTHAARIAAGFGVSALISVVLQGANNVFGMGHGGHTYPFIAKVESFSTFGFLGFWIVALWLEAPAPRELPDAMLMQIYTLQRRVERDLVRIRNWRRI